jgi:hypothetical protein
MKRLLDYDPLTGVRSDFESTEDGFHIHYTQDVEDILETNKLRANNAPSRMGEFVHAADVPITIQMQWMTEHGVDIYNPDHTQGILRLLNDPDYRYLKVRDIIL